jgi:hypothetical protein
VIRLLIAAYLAVLAVAVAVALACWPVLLGGWWDLLMLATVPPTIILFACALCEIEEWLEGRR